MRYIVLFLLFGLACNTQKEQSKAIVPIGRQVHYKTFEMTYSEGWGTTLSFSADSTGAFMALRGFSRIAYGIFPDSIRLLLDSALTVIAKDTSKHTHCCDCSIACVIAVSKQNDSLKLIRDMDINPLLNKVFKQINSYLVSEKKEIFGTIDFKTNRLIHPLPSLEVLEFLTKEERVKAGKPDGVILDSAGNKKAANPKESSFDSSL